MHPNNPTSPEVELTYDEHRARSRLNDFFDEVVKQGGVRPQGWSCVAHTRKAEDKKSGQMYFTFQSPVKTSYRSLAEALKACGLVSTNKRRGSSDGGAPTVCTMPNNAHAQGSPEAPIPPPKRSKTSKGSKPKQVPRHPDLVPLTSLTEADLTARGLAQIPITCQVQGNVPKSGTFHSAQLRTECVDTDCKECEGRTGEDRMMRCSGRHSFEEHCGRPSGQHYWKQGFKVQVKGYEGMSLEKFFPAHKIHLPSKPAPALQQASAVTACLPQPCSQPCALADPWATLHAAPTPPQTAGSPAADSSADCMPKLSDSSWQQQQKQQSHDMRAAQQQHVESSQAHPKVLPAHEAFLRHKLEADSESESESESGADQSPAVAAAPKPRHAPDTALPGHSDLTEPKQLSAGDAIPVGSIAAQQTAVSQGELEAMLDGDAEPEEGSGYRLNPEPKQAHATPQTKPSKGGAGSRVLNQDEKSVVRRLQRQLKNSNNKLAEAQTHIGSLQADLLQSRSAAQAEAQTQTLRDQPHPATESGTGSGHNTEAVLADELLMEKAKVADLQQQLQAAKAELEGHQNTAIDLQQAYSDRKHSSNAEQASKARVVELEHEVETVKRESKEVQEESAAADQSLRDELQRMQQQLQAARQASQKQQETATAILQELLQESQGRISKLQMENCRLRLQGHT